MKNNRVLVIILSLILTIIFSENVIGQDIEVIIEGKKVDNKDIIVLDGRSYIYAATLADLIGANYNWLPSSKTLLFTLGSRVVRMTIGSSQANIDGDELDMGSKVRLINNRAMVPLKFAAQTLLANTTWDAENRRIIVEKILVKVTSIRYNSYADYTRVAIDLNAPTNYKVDKLQDPERIFLTLYNTSLGVEEGLTPVSDPRFIKYIRAKSSDSTVQITLDLKRPADYATFTLKKPDRIVVDVKQPPAILVRKEGEREEEVSKEIEEEVTAPIKDEIVIVIDPGHGGHDPGAVGPTKLKEKDVVLDVAKRLKNLFKDDKKVKVFLTREGDVFIPLPDRTAFANKKQADIFISIHANAAYSSYAKGIETYYLDRATNKHALEVAMRENAWGFEIMDKAFADETNSLIEAILQDMVMTYKMDESKDLTRYIQTSMINGLKLTDRKVKGAPFLVLRGTLMPAILVEIAFISNPAEEKLLKTASFRQKAAQSLYQGIKSYVKATKGSWD